MKKLRLKDLQIKSFVTSVEKDSAETVKGGISNQQVMCDSTPNACGPNTLFQNCPTIFTDCACGSGTQEITIGACDTQPLKTILAKVCF